MTRVGHNPPFNCVSNDLRITQDAPYTRRYQVVGTVDPNAFSFMHGTYRTWLMYREATVLMRQSIIRIKYFNKKIIKGKNLYDTYFALIKK
jgi:hypothetical protein